MTIPATFPSMSTRAGDKNLWISIFPCDYRLTWGSWSQRAYRAEGRAIPPGFLTPEIAGGETAQAHPRGIAGMQVPFRRFPFAARHHATSSAVLAGGWGAHAPSASPGRIFTTHLAFPVTVFGITDRRGIRIDGIPAHGTRILDRPAESPAGSPGAQALVPGRARDCPLVVAVLGYASRRLAGIGRAALGHVGGVPEGLDRLGLQEALARSRAGDQGFGLRAVEVLHAIGAARGIRAARDPGEVRVGTGASC
jgi:hypothetical protein